MAEQIPQLLNKNSEFAFWLAEKLALHAEYGVSARIPQQLVSLTKADHLKGIGLTKTVIFKTKHTLTQGAGVRELPEIAQLNAKSRSDAFAIARDVTKITTGNDFNDRHRLRALAGSTGAFIKVDAEKSRKLNSVIIQNAPFVGQQMAEALLGFEYKPKKGQTAPGIPGEVAMSLAEDIFAYPHEKSPVYVIKHLPNLAQCDADNAKARVAALIRNSDPEYFFWMAEIIPSLIKIDAECAFDLAQRIIDEEPIEDHESHAIHQVVQALPELAAADPNRAVLLEQRLKDSGKDPRPEIARQSREVTARTSSATDSVNSALEEMGLHL